LIAREGQSVADAALASEASGQRGDFISARAGHSPEQGSSARAAFGMQAAAASAMKAVIEALNFIGCPPVRSSVVVESIELWGCVALQEA
jgi:hypothetical protein